MKMPMTAGYPAIPLISYEAIVVHRSLREMLAALIVDPHQAKDLQDKAVRKRLLPYELIPSTLADFLDREPIARDLMKDTIARWVMAQQRALDALVGVIIWDRQVGAWCAAAIAEVGIQRLPMDLIAPAKFVTVARSVFSEDESQIRAWLGYALEDLNADLVLEDDRGEMARTSDAMRLHLARRGMLLASAAPARLAARPHASPAMFAKNLIEPVLEMLVVNERFGSDEDRRFALSEAERGLRSVIAEACLRIPI